MHHDNDLPLDVIMALMFGITAILFLFLAWVIEQMRKRSMVCRRCGAALEADEGRLCYMCVGMIDRTGSKRMWFDIATGLMLGVIMMSILWWAHH